MRVLDLDMDYFMTEIANTPLWKFSMVCRRSSTILRAKFRIVKNTQNTGKNCKRA